MLPAGAGIAWRAGHTSRTLSAAGGSGEAGGMDEGMLRHPRARDGVSEAVVRGDSELPQLWLCAFAVPVLPCRLWSYMAMCSYVCLT